MAMYLCDCGNTKELAMNALRKGQTISCGCHRRAKTMEMVQKTVTHGLSRHPLYRIWINMNLRCYDKKAINYPRYGGIGVVVCDEWRNDFKAFYDWAIANGWQKRLCIDKDIKGNGLLYSPEYCLVVTYKQNANKMKSNVVVQFEGVTYTASELGEKLGIRGSVILDRIKNGYPMEQVVNTKMFPNRHKIKCTTTGKEFNSVTEAAQVMNLSMSKISSVCRGRRKHTKGYSFIYLNSVEYGIKHSFGYIG